MRHPNLAIATKQRKTSQVFTPRLTRFPKATLSLFCFLVFLSPYLHVAREPVHDLILVPCMRVLKKCVQVIFKVKMGLVFGKKRRLSCLNKGRGEDNSKT